MISQVISGQVPVTNTTNPAPPKQRKQVCSVCGKPSGSNICGTCSDRIRAEALARKRREDKGEE
jgi:hypothetical protein